MNDYLDELIHELCIAIKTNSDRSEIENLKRLIEKERLKKNQGRNKFQLIDKIFTNK